jgi:transposase
MLPLEVAMGRRVEPAWTVAAEQRAEVEALLRRTDLAPRVRERLEMAKAWALGHDWEQIAAWSGRSVRRVRHWLGRFRGGGAAGLADAPRAGRPVKADAAYLRALEAAVETPPSSLGLPFDVWTSGRLSAYLADTTGVRIAPGWLRALLARRDFVCGRPKHTLKHLQDADEVVTCKAALAEAGGKGGDRAGAVRAPLPG